MNINANCAGCGLCIDECNFAAISLLNGKAVINEDLCVNCGLCAELCPLDAIEYNEQGTAAGNPKEKTTGLTTIFSPNQEKGTVNNTRTFTRTGEYILNNGDRGTGKGRCMGRRRDSGKTWGFSQGIGSGRGKGSGRGSGSGKGRNR